MTRHVIVHISEQNNLLYTLQVLKQIPCASAGSPARKRQKRDEENELELSHAITGLNPDFELHHENSESKTFHPKAAEVFGEFFNSQFAM